MEFERAHKGEFGSSTRAVKQAIEAGQANVKWMQDNFQVHTGQCGKTLNRTDPPPFSGLFNVALKSYELLTYKFVTFSK